MPPTCANPASPIFDEQLADFGTKNHVLGLCCRRVTAKFQSAQRVLFGSKNAGNDPPLHFI